MARLSCSIFSVAIAIAVITSIPATTATTFPLMRNHVQERDLEWAIREKDHLMWKYNIRMGSDITRRQSSGSGAITNFNKDTYYYIAINVGTPPKAYNVLLDTGSSDLWLASAGCTTGCANLANLYSASQGSSTFNATGAQPFSITYISGNIQGTTAADTVSMAGFTVPNQPLGVITAYSGSALPPNVTGLMGLAFPRLARIGVPWWVRSAQLTPWGQPVFAFSLTRQNSAPGSGMASEGSTISIGQLDSSAYQGNIEYINIPPGLETWWLVPLVQIGIGGQTYTITNGAAASLAVVDTGTSLIGGPPAIVREIYAKIPGAQRGSGPSEGYWFYPCSASVLLTFNFGGRTWPMDPADFAMGSTVPGTCTGALFEASFASATGPQWIIGDAFLKNVYTVFRHTPPSVGFAAKPGAAIAAPSVTGSAVITAAATGTGFGPFGTAFASSNLPPAVTTHADGSGTTTKPAPGSALSKMGVMDGWMWLCLMTMGLVLAQ